MNDRESVTNNAIELLGVMDPGKKIDTCMEWARWKFRALCFSLALAGFGRARVSCGRRTFEEQCQLYGRGRSKERMGAVGISGGYADSEADVVSWLDPRFSQHVKGLAMDVDFGGYEGMDLGVVGEVARQLGITWGGVWSVRDDSHFEI